MARILSGLRRIFLIAVAPLSALWRRFRRLRFWYQLIIAIALPVVVVLLLGILTPKDASTSAYERTVELASIESLSGAATPGSLFGTVRSVTEAQVLAQSSGTVTRVHTRIGSGVGAGAVMAELENEAQRAAVLQAEGAYDAAVAARDATSLAEEATAARNAYRSAYTDIDTTLENDIDLFFGSPTAVGPDLEITAGSDESRWLSRERLALTTVMRAWQGALSSADTKDPEALLNEADAVVLRFSTFMTELSRAANARDAGTTAAQAAALASARTTVDGVLSSLSGARSAYRAGATSAGASADANVKQALGTLRLAEANLEKTIVRAPIGGTVNFLPLRVGDYITALAHVATVAQNGALEIVSYVSEDLRDSVTPGMAVEVEGGYDGTVTLVSPALDPTTKQIEVRIAVEGGSDLTNGSSVRAYLPETASTQAATSTGPVLLPLASVKLYVDSRVLFTVDEEGRLASIPVETGRVIGDRIEILTPLDPHTTVVTDARGLAEGQKVEVR